MISKCHAPFQFQLIKTEVDCFVSGLCAVQEQLEHPSEEDENLAWHDTMLNSQPGVKVGKKQKNAGKGWQKSF